MCIFAKKQKNLKTFEELGVCEEIRNAITELGFEQPMPVQEEVIPYLLGNRNDIIALAQTGTGKTAAFGIPLLQRTDAGLGAEPDKGAVPADCRRPERFCQIYGGHQRGARVWRYLNRKPNTCAETWGANHRGYSGKAHRPDEQGGGAAGGGEERGARRG